MLLQRKSDIEQRYNELNQHRARVSTEKSQIEDEMKRLQGEDRLIKELLETVPEDGAKSKRLKREVAEDAED